MSLLWNLTFVVILVAVSTLSTLSYVGGTPIVTILLMITIASPGILFFLVSFKDVLPIVYMLITATSLVVIAKDIRKISKYTRKYAMDYDIIILAIPAAASGALFGVLFKNLLSDFVIVGIQIMLMIYLLLRGFQQQYYYPQLAQGIGSNWAMEEQTHSQPFIIMRSMGPSQRIAAQNGTQPPSYLNAAGESTLEVQHQNNIEEELNPQLEKIIQEEQNRFSKPKLKIVCFVLLYTFLILLTKNASTQEAIVINPDINIPEGFDVDTNTTQTNQRSQNLINIFKQFGLFFNLQERKEVSQQKNIPFSRFEKLVQQPSQLSVGQVDDYASPELMGCVVGSFIFILIHLVLSYLSSKSIAIQITTKDSQKQKCGYVFLRQTDKMSSKKMWNSLLAAFFAGLTVGVCGVGGSIVLIPVWTKDGVDIQTAISSSVPITFFAALISMLISFQSPGNFYGYLTIIIMMGIVVLVTMLVSWLLQKYMKNNSPQYFRNRFRRILYISSMVALLIYGIAAYAIISKHFTKFGIFC